MTDIMVTILCPEMGSFPTWRKAQTCSEEIEANYDLFIPP